jgi:hypothetical protein
MNEETSKKVAYWIAWAGPIWVISFVLTWGVLGRNYPCPPQTLTGAELVSQYYSHSTVLIGMALASCFGILYMPWSIVMAYQMWQREKVPLLALLQLSGGILTGYLVVYVCAEWSWCARWAGTPGIDPETIKAIHLSTWYFFDMTYNITNVQLLGIGLFAILDRSEHRIFPAWLGWLALFTAASFFLETIMPYFNHGPLAINGWWNFWFGFGIWFVWFSIQSIYVLKEASRSLGRSSSLPLTVQQARGNEAR